MYVFREARHPRRSCELLDGLTEALAHAERGEEHALEALLRAGELECALLDSGDQAAAAVARTTDACAQMLVGERGPGPSVLVSDLRTQRLPNSLVVSPPEGFVYYALHPLDYAKKAGELAVRGPAAVVVGIRTIGATLSAVVAAALAKRGVRAQRFTVRPMGHPFERQAEFTAEQLAMVAAAAESGAEFLVVDEGPGLSGSSFLSVGDALLAAGAPHDSITFLCSHLPDPEMLRATNGATRWNSFRSVAVRGPLRRPEGASIETTCGEWRAGEFARQADWPSCWPGMQPPEFVSADRDRLYQFAGYPPYGAPVEQRARAVHEAGFGPQSHQEPHGFLSFPLSGRRMRPDDLTPAFLARMADYCAWRATQFAVAEPAADLALMLRINLEEEFGTGAAAEARIAPASPLPPRIVDGAMAPHHWLTDDSGSFVKLDSATAGDSHFFPGATDVAWDLAGAIVEWGLDDGAAAEFLDRYRRYSGDDPAERLPFYLAAYAAFRMGFCRMAAEAVGGTAEESRLWRYFGRYRAWLAARIKQPLAA